jgi:hypothetical protein
MVAPEALGDVRFRDGRIPEADTQASGSPGAVAERCCATTTCEGRPSWHEPSLKHLRIQRVPLPVGFGSRVQSTVPRRGNDVTYQAVPLAVFAPEPVHFPRAPRRRPPGHPAHPPDHRGPATQRALKVGRRGPGGAVPRPALPPAHRSPRSTVVPPRARRSFSAECRRPGRVPASSPLRSLWP